MVFIVPYGQALQYLINFCQPTCCVVSRQHLWSISWRLLFVPCYHTSWIHPPDRFSLWLVH